MGNCTAIVRLVDGTTVSVPLPAYSIAWAITEADGRARIVIGVIKKLASESSGWASLLRGRAAYPTIKWAPTPDIDDGASGSGAAKGYDKAVISLNKDGDAEIVGTEDSPWFNMEEYYKGGISMEGIDTLGLDSLNESKK